MTLEQIRKRIDKLPRYVVRSDRVEMYKSPDGNWLALADVIAVLGEAQP